MMTWQGLPKPKVSSKQALVVSKENILISDAVIQHIHNSRNLRGECASIWRGNLVYTGV